MPEKNELDPLVRGFIHFGVDLYHSSRFFSRPPLVVQLALTKAIGSLKSTLSPGQQKHFFRARLHTPRMEKPSRPFRGNAIKNPPHKLATAGRLNCAGISRLYLSSTEDVAAAETRAVTGDFVTVATFSLRRKITVFDFRDIEQRAPAEYKEFLAYIRRIISKPVFGYDNYECVLSQWVTEYMESLGVDAVIFPSVVRGRTREDESFAMRALKARPREFFNICAFRPTQFALVRNSPSVREVRELNVSVLPDDVYFMIKALREYKPKAPPGGQKEE